MRRRVFAPILGPTAVALSVTAALLPAQTPGMQLEVFDEGAMIEDRRGVTVPLDLTFRDEAGQAVQLRDYFATGRPVVLNLGYYGCPTLCGAVMQTMVTALSDCRLQLGEDYEVVSVTIDPSESHDLARSKKSAYGQFWDEPAIEEHWHLLTGDEVPIKTLAEAVGFGHRWDNFRRVWDHGAGLFLVSPDGKLTQTLFGLGYTPRDLRFALIEASEGTVGSAWDRVLLSCYTYDAETGTYGMAWTVVQIGGCLTVLGLASMLIVLWRRERRRVAPAAAAATTP
ncbi:MAG: SCO family protein [Planctomycetota bacterium]